jgi:hypothetical protein
MKIKIDLEDFLTMVGPEAKVALPSSLVESISEQLYEHAVRTVSLMDQASYHGLCAFKMVIK